jgi:hypothetical protein
MILIDAGLFDSAVTGLRDSAKNLFVITPRSGFRASARNDISIAIQHSSQHLGSAEIYPQNMCSHPLLD